MNCCCPQARAASRLFSWVAGSHRKRFERKGFEPSERQLVQGLERAGYEGASILEVGCGVGNLHQTLLEQGAAQATGVDLSSKMLEQATDWARERRLEERTRYVEGDFTVMADKFEEADVTVLDKVVCCYPDVARMVGTTLGKTRRVYALTYPRKRWYVSGLFGFLTMLMVVIRSEFRPYIHDPDTMMGWIGDAGFRLVHEDRTWLWQSQVWVRS